MHSLPWIRHIFHRLRGSQQKTFAFFIDALLVAQDVCLAQIARQATAQSEGRVRYTIKDSWRFLSNSRFRDDEVTRGLAEWIWPCFATWKIIPISIDWTHNEKRGCWTTLAASVTLNGRGIPIMMWSFRKADYDDYRGTLRDLHVANGECYSLGRAEYTDKAPFTLSQIVVLKELKHSIPE